jgi:hypothetical protein
MHQVVRAVSLAMFALALSACATLNAQSNPRGSREMAAINGMIGFRLGWINDSTTIDACSVYRVAGTPQQVAAELLPGFRDWFLASAKPCESSVGVIDRRYEKRVLVDSLALSDSTGRIHVTVRRGEQTHTEEYHLVRPTPRSTDWAVTRVVFSHMSRSYWVPPGRIPAATQP